jgi:hypothetical protein
MDAEDDPWRPFNEEVAGILSGRSAEFDIATISNLLELAAQMKATGCAVPHVDPGYWPTFNLTWEIAGGKDLEIEVFADRFEVYRFFAGRTDIRDVARSPGETFPGALLRELPRRRRARR